jgi:dihydrodipicolinate synthase/N-acetylneuraminate lyase
MKKADLPESIRSTVAAGTVIPAHPLALDIDRQFNERHQRALTRYHLNAGAGGVAIGVHSTQFEIRDPAFGLFEKVLNIGSETVDQYVRDNGREIVKVAGVCGRTEQAVSEAAFVRDTGYHAGLLSLAAFKDDDDNTLIAHCHRVAEEIPIVGFYLQPAAGGRLLGYEFWRRFAEIDNVIAVKMAPFNRYQTLDVIRGVCEAGRDDIALYTGNDDNIIIDLLTTYRIATTNGTVERRIVGGLLGHWAVWTQPVVEQFEEIRAARESGAAIDPKWLVLANQVTDANAVLFDAANNFRGCLSGINEVLRRQGLVQTTACLSENEQLSPGQAGEIDRIYRSYPHLTDDDFVRANLDNWLSG